MAAIPYRDRMNYFIFQSRQDWHDLSRPGKIEVGKVERWDATRYRSEMHDGDMVFLWLASPDPEVRGIYGCGVLVGDPYREGEDYFVKVRHEARYRKHLPAVFLKEQKALKNLWIFRLAIGTNYKLSQAEGEALQALAKRYAI